MKFSPREARELGCRIAIWAVAMSIGALVSADVKALVPFDERRFIYSASIELLSILVCMRLPKTPIICDVIDLSFYVFTYKMLQVVCFFWAHPAYFFIFNYVEVPFLGTMYILTFIRILWVKKTDGRIVPADWPVIGPIGFSLRAERGRSSFDNLLWFFVFGICAILCGLWSTAFTTVWYQFLSAGVGILFVSLYGMSINMSIEKSLTENIEHEIIKAEYESIVSAAEEILIASAAGAPPAKRKSLPTLVINNTGTSAKTHNSHSQVPD